jgi:hypothetical protein
MCKKGGTGQPRDSDTNVEPVREAVKRSPQNSIGFEVLTAVVMKSSVFRDVIPCSSLKVNRHFRGTCRLHLQGERICQARNRCEAGSKQNILNLRNTSAIHFRIFCLIISYL